MAHLAAFDPASLDLSGDKPTTAYLSQSIGAFRLTGDSGQAIFVWYHEDGRLDMHAHDLVFKGTASLGGSDVVAYAPVVTDAHEHAHELFLFSREPQSPHEGHRVFYIAHGHLHLWASDVRCLPVHQS
ncbi:hypothetical protein [Amorphus coralli]|uniref:hypothetical protein n=1 Tax=Amorphus coralli TaxID=340680 RepID=UPI000375ECCB|nr:hypothetical protein [Amorphus coralli]